MEDSLIIATFIKSSFCLPVGLTKNIIWSKTVETSLPHYFIYLATNKEHFSFSGLSYGLFVFNQSVTVNSPPGWINDFIQRSMSVVCGIYCFSLIFSSAHLAGLFTLKMMKFGELCSAIDNYKFHAQFLKSFHQQKCN